MRAFDPDALLAALPRREVGFVPKEVRIGKNRARPVPIESALGSSEEYNGFSKRERYRIADLSNWLAKVGATERPSVCDICGNPAQDEHAENYYDLSSWVGLCITCHRHTLHKRFQNPAKWFALLDRHELAEGHWTRLVAMAPFDLAAFVRARGMFEPSRSQFLPV